VAVSAEFPAVSPAEDLAAAALEAGKSTFGSVQYLSVILAQAEIQLSKKSYKSTFLALRFLDSRFRGNDDWFIRISHFFFS
jgi:hypothetical protein